MAQGLSKKRKEAPGSDRLSSHKHARGRPTQPDGHGQFEPVAHRTRSKSRLNHLDLQPTSLRVSPAKTSEGKNWNPIFSSSEGSSHAIEEQRGRATVRANDRERGHAGRTTIEQGEQSGSAIGRMTKAGGSPTRKPRSSHVDNQGYVAPTSSLHRPTTRSQTRSYSINNGGQAPNSSTLTLPAVATLPNSGVLPSSQSDTQFHGKPAPSSRATPREKPSKCRRKAVRNIGATEPADLRSMRMLYERAFPKPRQPPQVRFDLAATCLKKLIERVISNSPLSVSATITDLEFEQLDTAIYIVASILDELDREIEQEEVKSIQAMSLGSAPARRAIRTLDSIGQFLCPTTYNRPGSPVPIASYVYATTWLNWAKLWIQNPSHSLFDTCRPGLASCPFFVAGAHACWTKTAKRFALSVADQYSKSLTEDADRKLFARGDCWILSRKDASISYGKKTRGNGRNRKQKRAIYIRYRLLTAVAVGNDEAMTLYMERGQDSFGAFNIPTLHDCHAGNVRSGGVKGRSPGCANGIQHCHFGTTDENVEQQQCKARDRSQCSGHVCLASGERKYCKYVHTTGTSTGSVKPCLNRVGGPPEQCPCPVLCFTKLVLQPDGSIHYLLV